MKIKRHKPGPAPEIRHNLDGFTQAEIAEVFGLTQAAVSVWSICKGKDSGGLNLRDVIRWYIVRMKEKPSGRADLEADKLRLQCEKMTIEIDRMKAENIPLETHKQIFASRAMSLKSFMTEFFSKNLHHLAHKSIEQLRPLVEEYIGAMFNHYSSNHK
jgi:phage terminase Nu1 subunit (DNA packaging protein)